MCHLGFRTKRKINDESSKDYYVSFSSDFETNYFSIFCLLWQSLQSKKYKGLNIYFVQGQFRYNKRPLVMSDFVIKSSDIITTLFHSKGKCICHFDVMIIILSDNKRIYDYHHGGILMGDIRRLQRVAWDALADLNVPFYKRI